MVGNFGGRPASRRRGVPPRPVRRPAPSLSPLQSATGASSVPPGQGDALIPIPFHRPPGPPVLSRFPKIVASAVLPCLPMLASGRREPADAGSSAGSRRPLAMREPRGIIGVVAHAGPASEKDRDLSTSLPKPWRLLPHDPAAIERLASALRLAPITAQLLLNRGLTAPDEGAALPRRPADGLARPRAAAGRLRGGGAHLRGRAAGPPHLRLRRLRRGRRQRRRPPAAVSPPPRRPGRSVRAAPARRGLRPQPRRPRPDRGDGRVAGRHGRLRHRQRRGGGRGQTTRAGADRHRPPRIQGNFAGRGRAGPPASAGRRLPVRRTFRVRRSAEAGVALRRRPAAGRR